MQVIGLISGTSADGIDAALVNITGRAYDIQVELLAGATYPYPASLRDRILAVVAGQPLSMAEFIDLDDTIALSFAAAAQEIQVGHAPAELIGSHGQTVYHRPPRLGAAMPLGYSLQLGRGAAIAHLTGITTVSNFRAADIEAGGQGAPLVSPVDGCLLGHPTRDRAVQNIGGIGNVTYLPAAVQQRLQAGKHPSGILGWDTGPGNTLLDLAVAHFTQGTQTYDRNGEWAAQGTPCDALVQCWLQQDFFQKLPPKSTGREEFGQDYLHHCLADTAQYALSPADVLATLVDLTAASIAHSYHTCLPSLPAEVLLCGGGCRNQYLVQRIQHFLPSVSIHTTDALGLSTDFKEAIAFAVLSYWRVQQVPGNLPEVTGARSPTLLGEIHLSSQKPA